ncbi:MAG: hypothetical protein KDC05_00795 [Bacteroidales bacterium]|nr:hypothetical protein [Bacteroidales bacterium]
MSKDKFLIWMLFFAFLTASGQSGRNYRYIKPINDPDRVKITIHDKTRSYYKLHTEKASVILVRGPGVLTVRTRVQFADDKQDPITYRIRYAVDGEPVKEAKITSEPAGNASYKYDEVKGVPGNLKDFTIVLGRGEHSIEIFATSEFPLVTARYKFTKTKPKKLDWISYCPLTPSEPVNLLTSESSVTYYRFSKDKPLKVSINGPTELRVLTRIENHYQMRGRINYRVMVKEAGGVINTYQLSSVRSEVTTYESNEKLIPGKGREFVIDVPKGRHTYEISLFDQDNTTVLGRLLIPEKDVALEY